MVLSILKRLLVLSKSSSRLIWLYSAPTSLRVNNQACLLAPKSYSSQPLFPSGNQPSTNHSNDVKNKYEQASNETLESLTERFELIFDELADKGEVRLDDDADVTFSNGVLTIKLGKDLGTYVINKQSPNLQIWLSSPVSGPKRFDLIDHTWIYKHTGETLHQLLARELSEALRIHIDFSTCSFAQSKH